MLQILIKAYRWLILISVATETCSCDYVCVCVSACACVCVCVCMHVHVHTHALACSYVHVLLSNRLARSLYSRTEGSVTRERGIQQQALSIQTGNPPQATHTPTPTHTHTHTHTHYSCAGSMSAPVWRTEPYKEAHQHTLTLTNTSTHTLLREMKGVLGIRERDKGQRE